jgi:hypothetical protein
VICIVWIGVYPKPFLERMEPSVTHLLKQVEMKSAAAVHPGGNGRAAQFAWFPSGEIVGTGAEVAR